MSPLLSFKSQAIKLGGLSGFRTHSLDSPESSLNGCGIMSKLLNLPVHVQKRKRLEAAPGIGRFEGRSSGKSL